MCGNDLSGYNFYYFFIAHRIPFSICNAAFDLSSLSIRKKLLYTSTTISIFHLLRQARIFQSCCSSVMAIRFCESLETTSASLKSNLYPENITTRI